MVNESTLNKRFCQEEFVSTHHALFILNHRNGLQLERKRHVSKASIVSQPSSDRIFLLIKDGELVLALGKDHVDTDLVFANELRFNARVVVKAGKGVVDKFLGLSSTIHSLENCFELC